MRPFLRRIRYSRIGFEPLTIHANDKIIGPCLNQFPKDVVHATEDRRFSHPFEYEALLIAGQQGRDLHEFVVDDLKCYQALAFMEAFRPNDILTIHARTAFPPHSPELLGSPLVEGLLEVARAGDLGIYAEHEDEEMSL